MHKQEWAFAESVRFINRNGRTLIYNLTTKKWVVLSTANFQRIDSSLNESAGTETGKTGRHDLSAIQRTLAFLEHEQFLVLWDKPSHASECRTDGTGLEDRRNTLPQRRTLHFHVTQRCNLACSTCYVADSQYVDDRFQIKDISELFKIASEKNFRLLTITGGEPLMRRDLFQILELARCRFDQISLNTNGTLLTEKRCKDLCIVDYLQISLESADAAVHDGIRGAGTFEKVKKGLDELKRSGFPMERVSLAPTITKQNYQGLDRLLDIADKYGTGVSFGFFIPTGRGQCNQNDLTLGNREKMQLFEAAAEKRRHKLGEREESPERRCLDKVKTSCNIASILCIQANGDIFPCPNLISDEHCIGNFFLMNDLEKEKMFGNPASKLDYEMRTVDRVSVCNKCECRYFCGGGCMANAYAVNGSLYGRDPNCAFYKMSWLRHGPLSSAETCG
jgi:radical SAM protein with 4Fe4S-binding SPASM domain